MADVKDQLNDLVGHASDMSDIELREAHARLMRQYRSLRSGSRRMARHASYQLARGVETTGDYVKDRPLQAVAFAIGVGVLLGVALGHRR
jgi:ElaB/YqjD/DUF883 family membrane-anchored ribosome-binding protein